MFCASLPDQANYYQMKCYKEICSEVITSQIDLLMPSTNVPTMLGIQQSTKYSWL